MNKYIYVTQDDIDNGGKFDVQLCPVALSLKRHLHLFPCPNGHPPSEVRVRTTNVELGYGNCPYAVCNNRFYTSYRLSKFVSTQIIVFDLKGIMELFRFKLLD